MKTPELIKHCRDNGIHIELQGENLELNFLTEEVDNALIGLIKEHKSDIISYLTSLQQDAAAITIPQAENKEFYPITSTQFRFWILCQIEDINKAYNLPVVIKINGDLQVENLQKAVNTIVSRHEVLRTKFVETSNGKIAQTIQNISEFETIFNYEEATPETYKSIVNSYVSDAFDIKNGPLFRVGVVKSQAQEYFFYLNVHHIISDARSQEILIKDFITAYNNTTANAEIALPELPIQYKDYADWYTNNLELTKEEAYWLDKFSGELPVLNLPSTFKRPPLKTYNGAQHELILSDSTFQNVKKYAKAHACTPFMILLSALNGVLSRYTHQTDIILGTPVSGRMHPELEHQVGLYINTLPIRTTFEKNTTFNELVAIEKQCLQEAYLNANYSFGDLVNKLNIQRDISRSPIFDILVTHQRHDEVGELNAGFGDLQYTIQKDAEASVSKFDMTFKFVEGETSIKLVIEYNTDLYGASYIENLAENTWSFLANGLENGNEKLSQLPYISENQQQELLSTFNNTKVEYNQDELVTDLIAQQAIANPDATAVVCQGVAISYKELQKQSDIFASYLLNKGIQPNSYIGICMGRSIEMMIAILGVLKAGSAYVSLDPFYPIERIDYSLQNSGSQFVIVDDATNNIIGDSAEAINITDTTWKETTMQTLPKVLPSQTAYVIYTSGSTGKPKGVQVAHKNLLSFVVGMNEKLGKEATTWLASTSISFDISILELLWTLTNGNKVVIHLERPVEIKTKPEMDFSFFYFPTSDSQSTNKYNLLLKGATYADEHGFKAIWVPERHFHEFGDQFPNPSVAAAAVSTITKNIRLRSGSVVLPLHDEIRVAEEWSMVDNLSNGRVELSIASGWQPNDFVLQPNNFKDRHQIMFDKIDALQGLWKGETRTRTNGVGKEFEFKIHPKPIQPTLPLWITAAKSIHTFKYAGSIGANVLTHLLGQSIEDLEDKIKAYRESLQEHGFDPAKGKVAIMLHTFIHEDENYVYNTVEKPFKEYLKTSLGLLVPVAENNNMDIEDDMDQVLEMGFKRYYNTSSLFGTPEKCLDMVNKLYQAGINEIACLLDFGIEEDVVLDNLSNLKKVKDIVKRSRTQQEYIVSKLQQLTQEETTLQLLKAHNIKAMQATPSFYEDFLLTDNVDAALQNINSLLVGGEELKSSLAKKLIDIVGTERIYNMYGPTETTIWSAVKQVDSAENVTIGTPIANTHIYILDENQQICPKEVVGELCIGGEGVSQGYLGDKAKTDENFIKNPITGEGIIYKTGDLARWLPNGELEYLGRRDSQVKISGYRIELKEIQAVAASISGIVQCVVKAIRDVSGDTLALYIKADKALETEYIKDYLRVQLPTYMIPQHIIFVDEFKYTPNGKIDPKQLPTPTTDSVQTKNYVAPRNNFESQIAEIWERFLNIEKISIDDNFFEIGGNSMKAFELQNIMNSTLGLELQIISFFQFPTIRVLAESLQQHNKTPELIEEEMEDVDDVIDFMESL
ncbi:natural product biosynthesis luciferase-like monooxygenase protein [Kordia periserrulae]|uniref:Natural product biosynthesis luciferase-like monooxygenase protein n=1 Tax=Kordia periserrulae TaxID=701523 RepID=A0A2T6BZ66_9FLAO|nr:MupA/Atu3671 family FMN-dependent luciferase-like monooxygenase [Kordia periserrulae]PTX61364.1 natural product biosynthesis luciferase-like monooxygenase protein [Kordia periserrulae]